MLKKTTINEQLIACVLLMLALSATMGVVALRLGSALTSAIQINGSRQILAGQLKSGAATLEGSARGLALSAALQDQDEAAQLKSRLQGAADSVGKTLDALLASTEDVGVRSELDALQRDFRPLRANADQMLQLMNSQKIDQAMTFFSQTMLPQLKRLSEKSEKLMVRESSAFDRAVADTSSQNTQGRWKIITLLAFSVGAGSLIAVFVQRISGKLQSVAGALRASSTNLRASSLSVANAGKTLVEGATRQGAAVEETSASTEQLSATTKENAETSVHMADLMRKTDRVVNEGNRELQEMTGAMREINTSSERIRKILKVIDDIAFQTNILALNAAVEAARAGDAGMGFAVVADEVRNLAQRCASAARETAELIDDSAAKSTEGCAKLNRVTTTMASITSASAEVKVMAEQLTGSSQEQARGIQQIGQALREIERVTQESVVASSGASGAGAEMVRQAASLGTMVLALVSMVGEPAVGQAARQDESEFLREIER